MGWSISRTMLRTAAVGMGASLALMLSSALTQAASFGHSGSTIVLADNGNNNGHGNGHGNGNGGNDNGQGNNGQDNGNGNNNNQGSNNNGGNNLPEAPYAIMFPLAVGAAAWVVYRKRRQAQG